MKILLFFLIVVMPFIIAFIWYMLDNAINKRFKQKAFILKCLTCLSFIMLSKIYIETVINLLL